LPTSHYQLTINNEELPITKCKLLPNTKCRFFTTKRDLQIMNKTYFPVRERRYEVRLASQSETGGN
jgi:hypothetical protein